MQTKLITLVTIVSMVFTFNNVFAQTIPTDSTAIPKAYWVSGGIGGSSLGIELMANANAEIGNRWLITTTAQIESYIFGSGNALKSFNLLGGKIFKQKTSLFTVSAGLGAAAFDYPNRVTVGLPIILQYYTVVGQVFGFGLNGCVNLNTVEPTAGISLNIAIGRIQTHKPIN